MSELSVEKYINSVDTNTDEQNQKYLEHFHKIFQKESKLSKIPSFESNYEIASNIIDSYLKQNKFIVLLIGPTQFGKTGIIFQVMREMVTNNEVIAPFIFTLTGMANNDWREQTKNRVLPCMADNVWHYRDLIKKKNYLKQIILNKANVLIIIDEVHKYYI
jgi:predicted AAA+ superfamily ATPase